MSPADCGALTLPTSSLYSVDSQRAEILAAILTSLSTCLVWCRYLDHLVKELHEANYELKVSVYKPYHGTVIGKSGITVNKIKEATGVRIDIPKSGEASELITLTGPKDKCEEARKLILEIQVRLLWF